MHLLFNGPSSIIENVSSLKQGSANTTLSDLSSSSSLYADSENSESSNGDSGFDVNEYVKLNMDSAERVLAISTNDFYRVYFKHNADVNNLNRNRREFISLN